MRYCIGVSLNRIGLACGLYPQPCGILRHTSRAFTCGWANTSSRLLMGPHGTNGLQLLNPVFARLCLHDVRQQGHQLVPMLQTLAVGGVFGVSQVGGSAPTIG